MVQSPDKKRSAEVEQDAESQPSLQSFKMVLRIPETGLQLESSGKAADTLPLQAFAITLSDNVIEDLIQCVQNGDDIRLSLGNVPVSHPYLARLPSGSEGNAVDRLLFYLQDNRRQEQPHATAILGHSQL